MFFNKKSVKCEKCKSSIHEDFSFCPYCGNPMLDAEKESKELGMLGRTDAIDERLNKQITDSNLSFMDKVMDSVMNSMVRSMEKEMKKSISQPKGMSVFPSNIRIKVMPLASQKKAALKHQQKSISEEQIEKMSKFPRAVAKTKVRRLTDKIVYELSVPGLESPGDVFISKLENGYEIKAIGKNKVYVNSLPIELPIRGLAISQDTLSVEFHTQQ